MLVFTWNCLYTLLEVPISSEMRCLREVTIEFMSELAGGHSSGHGTCIFFVCGTYWGSYRTEVPGMPCVHTYGGLGD